MSIISINDCNCLCHTDPNHRCGIVACCSQGGTLFGMAEFLRHPQTEQEKTDQAIENIIHSISSSTISTRKSLLKILLEQVKFLEGDVALADAFAEVAAELKS